MTSAELLTVLRSAEQYLRHPEVQAIPFVLSAVSPLRQIREAIADLGGSPEHQHLRLHGQGTWKTPAPFTSNLCGSMTKYLKTLQSLLVGIDKVDRRLIGRRPHSNDIAWAKTFLDDVRKDVQAAITEATK